MSAGRVSGNVIDQIFALVLARLLAPADFGLFALASVFTSLFRVFSELGFSRAIVQRETVDDEYLSTAFWSSLAAGVFLTALSLVAGEVIAAISGQKIIPILVAVLSTRFIFAAGSAVQMAVISRRMEFRSLAARELAGAFVGGAVGVGIALTGGGVWALVGQAVAMTAASTLFMWMAIPWRPRRVFSWEKFKDLWAFGGSVLGSRSMLYLSRNMDNLLVGRFLGLVPLGYYALAYKILNFPMTQVAVILNRVVFAALSQVSRNAAQLRGGFLQATSTVALVLVPTMAGLAAVAPWFLEVVFSAKWLPATAALRILTAAGAVQAVMSIWAPVMQAAGRPDLQLKWTMIAVAAYLPAFAVGLRWGIEGVAVGFLVVTLALIPLQFAYLRQVLTIGIGEFALVLRPAAVGTAVMLAGLLPLVRAMNAATLPVVVELGILVGAGVVVYCATVLLVARREIRSLIRTVTLRQSARGPRAREALQPVSK
jgi:PST family polysaccharide transporter